MKGKPIRIDWDQLENAFNNKNEELIYYLDTVTGKVLLEGEGEDASFDDDDAGAPAASSDATRLYVEAPDQDTEFGWMRDFVEGSNDLAAELVSAVKEALDSDDPMNSIRDAFRDHGAERDAWFRFRSDRIHDYIDSWLDANGILPTDPAPWK